MVAQVDRLGVVILHYYVLDIGDFSQPSSIDFPHGYRPFVDARKLQV